jgi:hypothetical protein
MAMIVLMPLVFAGVTAGLLAGYLRFLRTSLLDEEAELAAAEALPVIDGPGTSRRSGAYDGV